MQVLDDSDTDAEDIIDEETAGIPSVSWTFGELNAFLEADNISYPRDCIEWPSIFFLVLPCNNSDEADSGDFSNGDEDRNEANVAIDNAAAEEEVSDNCEGDDKEDGDAETIPWL